MIKSSDKNFNNSYRILRVLENKDLLVIDSSRCYYIFAQFHSDLPTKHKYLSPPLQNSTENQKISPSNILYYQEFIAIDGINYLVFKMPHKDIIWANNIETDKLNQKTFTNLLVKQALMNILDKLLWLGSNFSHKLLSNQNFLLVNGHLYYILIPRHTKKTISLKRSEKNRSFSTDLAISTIIEKQTNIVKDFCQIIWFIIKKATFGLVKQSEVEDIGSSILIDLITKNINLESALQKFNRFSQKAIDKKNQTLRFTKKYNIKRRSTIDNSLIFKRKSNLGLDKYNQNLMSKKMKTQQVCKIQNQTTDQKLENSLFYRRNKTMLVHRMKEQQPSKVFRRRNYSFQSDLPNSYKTPQKLQPQTIPIFSQKKSGYTSQKQKNHYSNWIVSRNTKRQLTKTIQQKIQTQTRKALLKFEMSCSESKNVEDFKQKQQKLKTKLLQKVMRFKLQRFQKEVQTQQILAPQKNSSKQKINKSQNEQYLQQKSDNKNQQIIQHTESILNQNKNKLKTEQPTGIQKEKQLKPQEIKQQSREINIKKQQNENDDFVSSKKTKEEISSFKRYKRQAHPNYKQTESQIEEIILSPTAKQSHKKQLTFNKDKTAYGGKFQQLQDIQTLYFEKQQTKEKSVKKNWVQQPVSYKEIHRGKHIKTIELLVNQYLTFINILGDITASAIKNKAKLGNVQWRKTVYFLYQRFYYERIRFFDNLRNKNTKIIRTNRHAKEHQWNTWNCSSQRQSFLSQVEKENAKLPGSFKKFVQKLLKEDNLQSSLKQFLKGWQKIIHNKNQSNRIVIAKYAAAIIINEYDRIKQSQLQSEDSLHFLYDCLYGLKIVAELEELSEKSKPLDLSQYKRYTKNEEQIQNEVEQLYQLFYKQNEASPHS